LVRLVERLVETERRVLQEESTTWDRPKFELVLDEAITMKQRGSIEAIVFPRRNRLARFGSAGAYYLGLLDREGFEVHFAREGRKYEPSDPESFEWVMRGLSQAQADADEIRANTSWGRRKRAEEGHMMPSGGRKWAYHYHRYRKGWDVLPRPDSGRHTVNWERAAWVKRWADWILSDGMSARRVSRVMGEKYGISVARGTIVDILGDPILIGKVYAYKTKVIRDAMGKRKITAVPQCDWLLVYEDDSLRLLTDAQFFTLKEKFRLNMENSPRHTVHWYPPLRGLIFCSCGRRMTGRYHNGQPKYWCVACRTWTKAVSLWDQIRAGIRESLLDPGRLIPAIESQLQSGQSINRLEEEIESNSQKLVALAKAEEKALRLHLYLENHEVETLDTEMRRIREHRQQL